jgi:hypothetical protein
MTMLVDHVVQRLLTDNVVARRLKDEHSTHLLSNNSFLWDPFSNLETKANSEFLMSFSCLATQNLLRLGIFISIIFCVSHTVISQ